MSTKTGIVIPCYNEESRLPVERFSNFLRFNREVSCCFVNDGSSDKTLEVLNSIQKKYPNQVIVLDNEWNLGKAESVRKGMLHLLLEGDKFDSVGFLDADLSTSLEELLVLSTFLKEKNLQAVLGSRIKRLGASIKRSGFRHYIGRVIATFISNITRLPVYDTQCGAKVFATENLRSVLGEEFKTKWLFDVELLVRYRNLLGVQKTQELIYEYPLENWMEVGDSRITKSEFFKIPVELLKLYRISSN
jgi:glycosyltransferase involved in cell wall biosynthesis